MSCRFPRRNWRAESARQGTAYALLWVDATVARPQDVQAATDGTVLDIGAPAAAVADST